MIEILWAFAFGAFGGILFLIVSAVRNIQKKERFASERGQETSLSTSDGCIAVFVPLLIVGPFLALSLYLFLEDRSLIWLVLTFLAVLFLVAAFLLVYADSLKSGDKELDGSRVLGDRRKNKR